MGAMWSPNRRKLKESAFRKAKTWHFISAGAFFFLLGQWSDLERRKSSHPAASPALDTRHGLGTERSVSSACKHGLLSNMDAFMNDTICMPECPRSSEDQISLSDAMIQKTINLTVRCPWNSWNLAYGRYLVNFPEEGVNLRIFEKKRGSKDFRPRSITERLFRRIIAKLFHAEVLSPYGNIVNTGSWIGDNALPWAKMLESISNSEKKSRPGRVYAIDPSKFNLERMIKIAQDNQIQNLCTRVALFSAEAKTVYAIGDVNHLGIVATKQKGSFPLPSIPMDSLEILDVVLLHLDVEGHEAELLRGATKMIRKSRPVVITEGQSGWPPKDPTTKTIASMLIGQLGYFKTTSEIPEYCGHNSLDRNRIWWPDEETYNAAMTVIGNELQRPLGDWLMPELADV